MIVFPFNPVLKLCIEDNLFINQFPLGLKLLPAKLNLEGSNGWPLKGEPSASQAFFRAFICYSYYVVGKPICFLCC